MITARAGQSDRVLIDRLTFEERQQRSVDPWDIYPKLRPYKPAPKGQIGDYFMTRFDILARWLERAGFSLDTPCKAYGSGQNKMLVVNGVEYLTWNDGLIHIRKANHKHDNQ